MFLYTKGGGLFYLLFCSLHSEKNELVMDHFLLLRYVDIYFLYVVKVLRSVYIYVYILEGAGLIRRSMLFLW